MFSHPRQNDRSKRNSNNRFRSLLETLESRCLLSTSANDTIVTPDTIISPAASSSGIQGYTPAQIRAAYGITGDGAGQTIAIVDAFSDPNIAADLAVFDKQFGLSAPASFTQVSSNGSPRKLPIADAGWDTEIALDVEWAHAIAPKANIILVDAASDSLANLMTAVNYARSIPSVSVVSMSWGTSEFSGQTSYDSYFATPSGHTGITFVAASGDQGASGGAEWPAVSSNVLSVGGTTLNLTSSGSIASETAWSDSSGGTSQFETSAVQSSATGVAGRTSPDVSFDADPNTGFAVYNSVAYQGYVGWQEVGGTSAGAPAWAGIIAIADAARVAAKSTTLTTAQTLADVYSIYSNSSSYAANFRDVTSGSSFLGYAGGGFGRFGRSYYAVYLSASTGYDSLTGIGSPKVGSLIGALTSNGTASAKSASSATATASTKTSATAQKAAISEESTMHLPAALLGFEMAHNAAFASVEELDLPAIEVPATIAAMSSDPQSAAVDSSRPLAAALASASEFSRMETSSGVFEHVQYARRLGHLSSFSTDAMKVAIRPDFVRVGQTLDHSVHAAEARLAALSAGFSGRSDDIGRAATAFVFAVAEVVLLTYRNSSGKGRKAGGAFNAGPRIHLIDGECFA